MGWPRLAKQEGSTARKLLENLFTSVLPDKNSGYSFPHSIAVASDLQEGRKISGTVPIFTLYW
jgi:hypothetical protein